MALTEARPLAGRLQVRPVALGIALIAAGWAVLWSVDTYWNPLAFTALWTGLALAAWGASRDGYPGVRRHLWLAALSVPVWWWFELVNERVRNWSYVYTPDYSDLEYALFSTIAFSTVIPALVAVSGLLRPLLERSAAPSSSRAPRPRLWQALIAAGVALQVAVFAFPTQMYLFVWIAPFLMVDGLLERTGRRGLSRDLLDGRWRDAARIALAGLACGVLWEFWNFWAMPRWEYDVPLLGFWKVFEMPLLGYGGYVPFAWSILQFVRLVDGVRGAGAE